jgi:hypothetical protein
MIPTSLPPPRRALPAIEAAIEAIDNAVAQSRLDGDPMRYILEALSAFLTGLASLYFDASFSLEDQIKRAMPVFGDQHIDRITQAMVEMFQPRVSTILRTVRLRLAIQALCVGLVVFTAGGLVGWFAFGNYPTQVCRVVR